MINIYLVDILIVGIIICIFSEFRCNPDQIEYMNKNSTSALQGIVAIIVVLHHLSQQGIQTCFSSILLESGKYSVAIFFLISGYGVTYSTLYKKNYMDNFISSKLKRVVLPYIFITAIYYLAYKQLGRDMSLKNLIYTFIYQGRPIIENSWYVVIIIILYFSFYCFYCKLKKMNYILIGVLGISSFFIVIIRYLFHWQEYWYNTILCFSVGMVICMFSDIIHKVLEQHYKIVLLGFICTELIILLINYLVISSVWIEIVGLMIFTMCIFLIMIKINYKGGIWGKISTISLEIYLVHRLVYTIFRSEALYIKSDLLYVFLVLLISIGVGYGVKKIEDFVNVKLNKIEQR